MGRRAIERRLEGFVGANRFALAVVFPLVGAALLVASAESILPAPLAFNPALILVGTLAMRLPLIAGLLPLATRRALVLLAATTAYVYAIELLGVATGWPYGRFAYGVELGPMIAGVPAFLPLFFLPLVVNGYLLAVLLLGARADRRPARVAFAVATVVAIDLVLDPGAVGLGFWAYTPPGPFYGVPVSNFAGWVLSGLVAVVALDLAVPVDRLRERLRECEFLLDDHLSFVLLWGAVNAFYAHWLPVAVALLLAMGLLRSDRVGRPALARVAGAWSRRAP